MYFGDFLPGSTVYLPFSSANKLGGRVGPSNDFEAADFLIYKNGSATERSSTAGVTITTNFDSKTGQHMLAIDTSDNTDAGFYEPGATFCVLAYPDETVDSETVGKWIGAFSLGRRDGASPIIGFAAAGAAGSITLPSTASATDDFYNGCFATLISGTGAGQSRIIIDYNGTTKVATVSPNWVTNPTSTTGVMVTAIAPQSTEEYTAIANAVITQSATTPIEANVVEMNAAPVTGTGTSADLWRGVE